MPQFRGNLRNWLKSASRASGAKTAQRTQKPASSDYFLSTIIRKLVDCLPVSHTSQHPLPVGHTDCTSRQTKLSSSLSHGRNVFLKMKTIKLFLLSPTIAFSPSGAMVRPVRSALRTAPTAAALIWTQQASVPN